MKVYLAGPMNNIPEYNHPAFHRAEACLVGLGYQVVSPARDNETSGWHEGSNKELAQDTPSAHMEYMRRDITLILDGCEAIFLMDGWENSSGANVELAVARALGLKVLRITEMTKGFVTQPTRAIPSHKLQQLMIQRADLIQ